ncbi:TetR/AcrR family transcriptional regulator [Streptomyces iconiensis]|uniref:TetR/AcrR family transcriptional regulator n=1 Tax=Streptomyces iconiensis TaxID=1384038 RepID=A0ABT6ZV11_9ACTN|nr:TetR/AcrR family transcriptional regulator [Streptomyces iconiensis]MDJ1132283.1 TetR/AcrR family transcriptional regulator [Streptomyces iconiensis]
MTGKDERELSRGEEIADAAVPVFLRYGLRKTSMDDLAAAAGLSRQGLYLHFRNKQQIFHAALQRVVARTQATVAQELARADRPARERLLSAFTALHGPAATATSEGLNELLTAAHTVGDSLMRDLERSVVDALAAVLHAEGAPERTGISAEDLAWQMLAIAAGVKHLTVPPEDRPRHIQVAITLVLGPPEQTPSRLDTP